jgi:hypothetical protein
VHRQDVEHQAAIIGSVLPDLGIHHLHRHDRSRRLQNRVEQGDEPIAVPLVREQELEHRVVAGTERLGHRYGRQSTTT